jgi:hypothetical protein
LIALVWDYRNNYRAFLKVTSTLQAQLPFSFCLQSHSENFATNSSLAFFSRTLSFAARQASVLLPSLFSTFSFDPDTTLSAIAFADMHINAAAKKYLIMF